MAAAAVVVERLEPDSWALVVVNCLPEQRGELCPEARFLYQMQLKEHIKAAAMVLLMMRLCMAAVAGIVLALRAAQTNPFGAAVVAVLLPQTLLLALRYLVEMVARVVQPGLLEHSPAGAVVVLHQEIPALAALVKSS